MQVPTPFPQSNAKIGGRGRDSTEGGNWLVGRGYFASSDEKSGVKELIFKWLQIVDILYTYGLGQDL